MINMVLLKEAVLSNVTGLDAIQRAPIVPYKTKHKCLRIQNVAHCEPYEKWGYTDVSDNNYHSFQLRKDDIIISRTGGSIGSVMYISQDYNSVFNNGLIRLKIDTARFEPIFIYYCLKNKQFAKHIEHCSLGNSTQENIRMNDMLEYRIPNYPLDVQKRIASILWKLDEKMTNNNATCFELEAMAKLLYDYWFVQFDFPDENGKPYKSSGGKMVWNDELKREIPDGWEIGNLYDIADYLNGLACQKFRPFDDRRKLPVIKINEMHNGFGDNVEWARDDVPQKNVINNGDILFSWSATLETMIWNKGRGVLNQHIFKVVPKEYNKYYVFQQLSAYVINFVRMAEARKTTMGHITTDHLKQSRIPLPPKQLTEQYGKKISSIYDLYLNCSTENQELASLRDFLLPMLMNGQLKID